MKRAGFRLTMSFIIAAVSVYALTPSGAPAATLTKEIRSAIEYAQSVLADSSLSESIKKEMIKQAAYDIFDFTEMSKRVLGRHWTTLTPLEQREFTVLFTELLERVYFNRIKLVQDAKFSYSDEVLERDLAVVRSKATTAKGETAQIEFRLRFTGGKWKIYDVSVEGISLVANYRTQFNQIISKGGMSEVFRRLREKTR